MQLNRPLCESNSQRRTRQGEQEKNEGRVKERQTTNRKQRPGARDISRGFSFRHRPET